MLVFGTSVVGILIETVLVVCSKVVCTTISPALPVSTSVAPAVAVVVETSI